MILNDRKVVSYMRVSPRLLVCGLEGDQTYQFRGDKAYVDSQEQHVKRGLGHSIGNVQDAANPLTCNSEASNEEALPLPVYNFDDRSTNSDFSKNIPPEQENALLIPIYTFDRK